MATFQANVMSKSSIESLKRQLEAYRDSLPQKCERVVQLLAESGIQVAKSNVGSFGRYISFSTELEPNSNGCKALIVATNTGTIKSSWQTSDGVKTVDVNALLMCEFGSGFKAKNPLNVPGVGQGTFPGQVHAFDREGWFWQDLNDEWHHSYGISPSMPMYKASQDIMSKAEDIVMEVFGQ